MRRINVWAWELSAAGVMKLLRSALARAISSGKPGHGLKRSVRRSRRINELTTAAECADALERFHGFRPARLDFRRRCVNLHPAAATGRDHVDETFRAGQQPFEEMDRASSGRNA